MSVVKTFISENLTLEEVGCHDGLPYPVERIDEEDPQRRTWFETRLAPLAGTFEEAREAGGDEPVHVDSGYRDEAYDERLYIADRGRGNVAPPQGSQHPKGRALDLKHSTLSPQEFHDRILAYYRAGKMPHLGGIGLYPGFVHIDIAPRAGSRGGANDGHLRQWGGTRDTNVA